VKVPFRLDAEVKDPPFLLLPETDFHRSGRLVQFGRKVLGEVILGCLQKRVDLNPERSLVLRSRALGELVTCGGWLAISSVMGILTIELLLSRAFNGCFHEVIA